MEVPLLYCGKETGKVLAQEEGIRVSLQASAAHCCGICRAYATGEQGRVLIGVMEPGEAGFYCSRIISRSQWKSIGRLLCGEIEEKEESREKWNTVPVYGFFRFHRWQLPQGALWRRGEKGRFLALPFSSNRPFPLPELFCFSRIQQIRQENYAVFLLNEQEMPLFF